MVANTIIYTTMSLLYEFLI